MTTESSVSIPCNPCNALQTAECCNLSQGLNTARILVTLVTTSNQWETCWCFWHRQAGLVHQTIHENRQFCSSNPPFFWTNILSLGSLYTPSVCPPPIHQSIDIHSLESTWKNVENPCWKPFGKWSTFMMASPRNINVSRRVSKFQKETVPVTNPISTSFFPHRTMVPMECGNSQQKNHRMGIIKLY